MVHYAIEAHKLGKAYRVNRLQGVRPAYGSLRDELAHWITWPFRALRQGAALGDTEEFWALRNVDLQVTAGESVGIIGRNGAGKSTLLKILSRVTPPTTGMATLRGRVGSLLEVGAGFHPELTGRENIFLNGAVLGMSRREIRRKFDEIVAFAEVDRFLDTPVKRYSSGMHVRLAFAVAAHLDPDILIVDEVLAVGDVAFQKKCLAKMQDVGAQGRTVLFVSHSMSSVTRFCQRAILLEEGQVIADGPAEDVVRRYLHEQLSHQATRAWPEPQRPGNDIVRLCSVSIFDEQFQPRLSHDIRRPVIVQIETEVLQSGVYVLHAIELSNNEGVCLFASHERTPHARTQPRRRGRYRTWVRIPGNLLAEGSHYLGVACFTLEPLRNHFRERECLVFDVYDRLAGDSARVDYGGPFPGVVRPVLEWWGGDEAAEMSAPMVHSPVATAVDTPPINVAAHHGHPLVNVEEEMP